MEVSIQKSNDLEFVMDGAVSSIQPTGWGRFFNITRPTGSPRPRPTAIVVAEGPDLNLVT